MDTSGFDRHLDFHNEWVFGWHSFGMIHDPSTFPCSKTIMQHITATCYVILLLPVYCPSYWKCTVRCLYSLQSFSFFNLQHPKTSHLWSLHLCFIYWRTVSVVAKPENGWDIDMATKTGSNYICGTMRDSVEIPRPNSGFSMRTSST